MVIKTSQMQLQCPNFSKCDNQTDDNCDADTYTRTWMSNMDVEENETSAALVSVLSKMVNPDEDATRMKWPLNKVSDKIF